MDNLNLQVVTPNLYTPNGPGFILYPILDESDSNTGIFSCEIFMETHCACIGNGACNPFAPEHMPDYSFGLGIECNCSGKSNGISSPGKTNAFDERFMDADLEISPNPFRDFVQVRIDAIDDNREFHIRMFDSMGKTVHDQQYKGVRGRNNFKINTSLLTQGVYYFLIDNGNYRKTEKLILMK